MAWKNYKRIYYRKSKPKKRIGNLVSAVSSYLGREWHWYDHDMLSTLTQEEFFGLEEFSRTYSWRHSKWWQEPYWNGKSPKSRIAWGRAIYELDKKMNDRVREFKYESDLEDLPLGEKHHGFWD